MRTYLTDEIALKDDWPKVTIKRGWELVESTLPWCLDHVSTGRFCSVALGRVWYFSKEEDALIFKLKFG